MEEPQLFTASNMADVKAKLTEELETINNSLKGKKTIENAQVVKDLPTNNSKDDMFGVIKELYKFSKKVLSHIGPADDRKLPDDVTSLFTQQLADVLPGLLKEALDNHSSTLGTTAKEAVKDKVTVPSTSHTLVIENMQSGKDTEEDSSEITEQSWANKVKSDVRQKLKSVPVIKASASNGAAKLHFTTREHMDLAQEALKSEYKVTSKTHERKLLDPKLTISDIDSDIDSKDVLEDKILEKNDFIKDLKESGEMVKIVFFDKKDRFAVLQVSAVVREAIRQNDDRVCVDLERHRVRDRIHVIQCFHCQEYGHMSNSTYCKQKDSAATCFYCAGSHASKECNRKKEKKTETIKCSNCAKSNNPNVKRKCNTHKASDNLCPSYVREKERMMDRTAGCEEAKNFYRQRVKEQQRSLGRV